MLHRKAQCLFAGIACRRAAMVYVCYMYMMPANWLLGKHGVVWLMSTQRQQFSVYDLYIHEGALCACHDSVMSCCDYWWQ